MGLFRAVLFPPAATGHVVLSLEVVKPELETAGGVKMDAQDFLQLGTKKVKKIPK